MGHKPHRSIWKQALDIKTFFRLIKTTFSEWNADGAPQMGAALSYYTIFSLAPLLIIAITIVGLAFQNAQTQVMAQIEGFFGEKTGEMIDSMMTAARKPQTSIVSTILGFVTLFFGAAGVFVQLKNAFNKIWKVKTETGGGIIKFFRKYLLSFSMVMGVGFLMLVSFILSTVLSMIGAYVSGLWPGMEVVMNVVAFLFSFVVISLLFAMLFKYLPDVPVRWRDVVFGAVLTSFLFTIGKMALGIYFTKMQIETAYGTAGSLILILLWVFYAAQILFFGAEFTQVHAKYRKGTVSIAPPKKLTGKERLVATIERERLELASLCGKVDTAKIEEADEPHYFSRKEDYKKRFAL